MSRDTTEPKFYLQIIDRTGPRLSPYLQRVETLVKYFG